MATENQLARIIYREAVNAAFIKTEYQRCIVHQVRNTLKYVADKDRKEFAEDLKKDHHAISDEQGAAIRNQVEVKWRDRSPNAMKS